MGVFTTKITRQRVVVGPFTAEQMSNVGSATVGDIVFRIGSATDVHDSPSKPLTEKYARSKVKGRHVALSGSGLYRGLPVRDWTLRGRTLASLKVKSASEDRVTIGPTTVEAAKILASRRQDQMWGISPRNMETLYAAIRYNLLHRPIVTIHKEGKMIA